MRFSRFITKHGIYVLGKGEQRVFLALYVNGLFIVWNNKESLAEVKGRLKGHFKVKDLGSAQCLLGVENRCLEGWYSIVWEKYACEVVTKFGMGDTKEVSTPFEPGSTLGMEEAGNQTWDGAHPQMVDILYKTLVGSLMYIAMYTRPDLAMDVFALSSFRQKPQLEHWEAAKEVLRYAKGTAREGLGSSLGEEIVVRGDISMLDTGVTLRPRGGGLDLFS